MEGQQQETEEEQDAAANVVRFLARSKPRREPPMTDEEIAEYRRIRPRLLRMLDEWDRLKGPLGCPVARHVVTDL
jgi:hypothetical protein